MTPVEGFQASSAAVEAVLDQHGITDPSRRRRVRVEARRRLEERATRELVRLQRQALLQGWRPPPSAIEVVEPPAEFPVPIGQGVYCRVVRWIRNAGGEFSVRDLMRASNFFETASDARAILDGLIKQGEVEVLEPPLRWPGERGRPPGPRYRAVRGGEAVRIAADATREIADVEDLDWSDVLGPDET